MPFLCFGNKIKLLILVCSCPQTDCVHTSTGCKKSGKVFCSQKLCPTPSLGKKKILSSGLNLPVYFHEDLEFRLFSIEKLKLYGMKIPRITATTLLDYQIEKGNLKLDVFFVKNILIFFHTYTKGKLN